MLFKPKLKKLVVQPCIENGDSLYEWDILKLEIKQQTINRWILASSIEVFGLYYSLSKYPQYVTHAYSGQGILRVLHMAMNNDISLIFLQLLICLI